MSEFVNLTLEAIILTPLVPFVLILVLFFIHSRYRKPLV